MAYCVKCGAYIPDGQTVCLACGYDPASEQKEASAAQPRAGSAARQYSRNNEELRRRLDEQRKRSQEKNREWAEQERLRREEQAAREAARREQQERDREWAREEYEKRQEEQRRQEEEARRSYNPDTGEYHRSYNPGSQGEGNRALAALSYLSVLFALPYIFAPNDRYAKFHAKQGLKLFIFGILADVAASLVGIGWIVSLARLYLIYKGMSNALNGKTEPLPYIGTIGD